MTYKIGTRVKKVRSRSGSNLGNTGIVVAPDDRWVLDEDYDIFIKHDQPCYTKGAIAPQPSGTITRSRSTEWEPIIPDGHQPCEEGWNIDTLFKKEQENVSQV